MKCARCKGKVDVTFLNKIRGTYVSVLKGKKRVQHVICQSCQKQHSMEKIKKEL